MKPPRGWLLIPLRVLRHCLKVYQPFRDNDSVFRLDNWIFLHPAFPDHRIHVDKNCFRGIFSDQFHLFFICEIGKTARLDNCPAYRKGLVRRDLDGPLGANLTGDNTRVPARLGLQHPGRQSPSPCNNIRAPADL